MKHNMYKVGRIITGTAGVAIALGSAGAYALSTPPSKSAAKPLPTKEVTLPATAAKTATFNPFTLSSAKVKLPAPPPAPSSVLGSVARGVLAPIVKIVLITPVFVANPPPSRSGVKPPPPRHPGPPHLPPPPPPPNH